MIFDCYHWRLELKERQVEKSVSQIGFTETNATIKTTVLRKARIFNSNDQWLYRAASHCHYKRKKIAVLLTVLPRPMKIIWKRVRKCSIFIFKLERVSSCAWIAIKQKQLCPISRPFSQPQEEPTNNYKNNLIIVWCCGQLDDPSTRQLVNSSIIMIKSKGIHTEPKR